MEQTRRPDDPGPDIGIYLADMLPDEAGGWAHRAESLGLHTLALSTDAADDPARPVQATVRAVAATGRQVTLLADTDYRPGWRPEAHAEYVALLEALTGGRYLSALVLPDGPTPDLDAQLEQLHHIRLTLPPSSGPLRLLIGGPAEAAAGLIARYGEGWFLRAGTPERFAAGADVVRAAWTAAGRSGRPSLTAAFHYAVGDDASTAAEALHHRYRTERGPAFADAVIAGSATDEAEIGDRVAAFAAAGADRVLGVPAIPDIDQLDRFAAVLLPTLPTLPRPQTA